MRKPRRYVAKDGSVSWRVRFRSADGLTEKSETFYDQAAADEFAHLLRALGPAKALAYLDDRDHTEGDGKHALTVDDVWAKWIDWKSATRRDGTFVRVRSSRTVADYRRMYTKRIRPALGSTPANLVAPADVQDWVDALATELNPKTIADYHSILHAMYLWAGQPSRGLVIGDPCLNTQLPKRRRKPAKGLRPDEWQILYRAAVDVDPAAADLLHFMVASGWRWSETVAVQVMAVDHSVDQDGESFTYVAMGRVLRREANYQFVIVEDDAKSEAGARRVRIRGAAEQMLLRRISGRRPDALIFTTARGKGWSYSNFHSRTWSRPPHSDDAPGKTRILERAAELGLQRPDLTPHWMRHTSAAMLILSGEPLPVVQRRLGHASIKTTIDVYSKMIDESSGQGLDRMAAMIDGVQAPPELTA